MQVLVEFSEARPHLHRLLNTPDYQTIDTHALIDYVCSMHVFGDSCVEQTLIDCLDSVQAVGDAYEDRQTFERMSSDIFNLITCIFAKLDELTIQKTIKRSFTNLRIVGQWRNLYVLEFS